MRKIVLAAALMGAAVMVAAPAQALVNISWSFADQDGRGLNRGIIFNVADNGDAFGSTGAVYESPITSAIGSNYSYRGNASSSALAGFVFENGQVTRANVGYAQDGGNASFQLASGLSDFTSSSVADQPAGSGAGSNPVSYTITSVGPAAPGPLAGVGLLPALAGAGALFGTRFRRRKPVAA
jgi:hypothetical protein